MVIGACQNFRFFRQITWLLENNRTLSKFRYLILYKIKNPVDKSHFYINHGSLLQKCFFSRVLVALEILSVGVPKSSKS